MKSAIIALCVIGCAYAALDDTGAQILSYAYQQNPEGGFLYSYETDNNIQGQAEGRVKFLGKDEQELEVTGSNQYISPEGEPIVITYVANANGYQPSGKHLPTPPPPAPIPEYIARSLAYIAAHPYVEKKL